MRQRFRTISAAIKAILFAPAGPLAAYALVSLYMNLCIPAFEMCGDELAHFETARAIAATRTLPKVNVALFKRNPSGLVPLRAYQAQPWQQQGLQAPLYHIVTAPLFLLLAPHESLNLDRLNRHQHSAYIDGDIRATVPVAFETVWWKGEELALRLGRVASMLLAMLGLYFCARVLGLLAAPPALACSILWFLALHLRFVRWTTSFGNDSLLFFASNLFLWQLLSLIEKPNTRRGVQTGLAAALVMLTKASGLLAPVIVSLALLLAVLLPAHSPHTKRSVLVRSLSLSLGLGILLGSWWYIRNLAIYGNLTSMYSHVHFWDAPPKEHTGWWPFAKALATSFWGSLIPWLKFGEAAGVILLAIGFGAAAAAGIRRVLRHDFLRLSFLLLGSLMVLNLVALVVWNRHMNIADWRLLIPTHFLLCAALVAGWLSLLPMKPRAVAATVMLSAWFIAALRVPALVEKPVYDRPHRLATIPADFSSLRVEFANGIQVEGFKTVLERSGEGPYLLTVSLLFVSTKPMNQKLSLFFHLEDEAGYTYQNRNRYHGQGWFPTNIWPVGYRFEDKFYFQLNRAELGQEPLFLFFGFYPLEDEEAGPRVPVWTDDAQEHEKGIRLPVCLYPKEMALRPCAYVNAATGLEKSL